MKASRYETLTAEERFQLFIEAMARRDDVECDRLEDSCPTRVYRCEDANFRDRVRRAYSITVSVCLNSFFATFCCQAGSPYGRPRRIESVIAASSDARCERLT